MIQEQKDLKTAYRTIIMCRKKLPTIEERLQRVMDDIGPQDIPEEASEFFYSQPNATSNDRHKSSVSPFEHSN